MKTPILVACLVLALALMIVLLTRRGSAASGASSASGASLLLLGPTNLSTGSFVGFCLSNCTREEIACVPEAFEQQTQGEWVRAPVTASGSTGMRNWIGLKEELKPGGAFTFLVPTPTNAGLWRLVFICQERSSVVDPVTDTVRHLANTNARNTRQYSGRKCHVTSPEVRP